MRIFLILLVSASLAIHASADDGWQKARWGMTKEEVAKLYPEAKPETKAGGRAGGEALTVGLYLAEYPLVDGYFHVGFLFNPEGKLAAVRVDENNSQPREGDKTFLRLKRLLTERYGKPVREDPPEPMVTSLAWHDGDREISLTQILDGLRETSSVTLTYNDRAKVTRTREAKEAEEKSTLERL